MRLGRAATLASLLVGLSACGASDGPAAAPPEDVIEHLPSITTPCEVEADCASGICVPDLCPLTLPGASFCGRQADQAREGCAGDETCVDVTMGKYAQACPSEGLETACVPLSVCADALLGAGIRCGRDWECESGDCIGIQCETPPDAFAFGVVRVCASSRCAELPTETVTPLGECAATTQCEGPGASYVPCVHAACPDAYSSCEADPDCAAILACAAACPESGFWSCLDACMVSHVPCAAGEEERAAVQGAVCFCVPESGCD